MAVKWTDDQKRVIEARNKNILVSAAAGSGKTAVLVERIISMVCGDLEGEEPIDVDRLLVVTFTRAAAAEMRERVGLSLEKRLEADPENTHLQRQTSLIHNAQITTIDSFCQYVVRSYFHRIDIDPSFRIGDEGELKLLKADVLKELLEERYALEDGEEKRRFTEFVEIYAPGRSDAAIEDLILRLYEFAVSYPDPKRWLDDCAAIYAVEDVSGISSSGWMRFLLDYAARTFEDLRDGVSYMIELTKEADGPYMYQDALTDDLVMLKGLAACGSYEEIRVGLSGISYTKLSGKSDDTVSPQKRESVKTYREGMKKSLRTLKDKFFALPLEEVYARIRAAAPATAELIGLTERFIDLYDERKRAKNLADFQDLEHLALKILVERVESAKDGTMRIVPTDAARELSEKYICIMTDEYQDSNLIQETVISSVAFGQGRPNLFMVGDVKQSIYRFRKARPELFMEKYDRYRSKRDPDGLLITLGKNFRSRNEVLLGVNYIFGKLMDAPVGGVTYDADAALYPGASYPADERGEYGPELLLLETDADEDDPQKEMTACELEALAAAERIKELIRSGRIWDAAKGGYVSVRYKDIVILLRSLAGQGEVYARVLTAAGIPAHTDSNRGYFDTLEVQTVLNLLKIVDNPRQDIPLAAVMKSMIGGFSDIDLARIKSAYPELYFHEACRRYADEGCPACGEEQADALRGKLKSFYERLAAYRRAAAYMDIHELIEYLMEDTGYMYCLEASPGGAQRTANVRMLVQKAISYEKTSYRGLFNFVRYIDKLQSYDEDFGEAGIFGENEDAVRIMTIHKSKGLEFPVVIVGGLGRRFNKRDLKERVVLHPDMGIGVECVDTRRRVRTATLPKSVIQKASDIETLGEELRVLYVAMTRAKEKLILLGSTSGLEKKLQKYAAEAGRERLGFRTVSSAQTFLDWILPAAALQSDSPFELRTVRPRGQTLDAVYRQLDLQKMKETLRHPDMAGRAGSDYGEKLAESLSYVYPFKEDISLPVKFSVSELKRAATVEEGEEDTLLYAPETPVPYIPRFMKEDDKRAQGTERGTAYHRAMQFIDFKRIISEESVEEELLRLEEAGLLSPGQREMIRPMDIFIFAGSDLSRRMEAAKRDGRFRAEQPFVIGLAAAGVTQTDSEETVLVQGIIDAYFSERDSDGVTRIVLADYKTDYVHEGAQLVRKYKSQLDYYAEALQRQSGCKVKEKIIYSFCLGREIRL